MPRLIKFKSVSLKPALTDLSFEFENGVMCVVSDRESSENAVFALASGELFADSGSVQNDFKTAVCTNGLPCEVKVKDYLKFVLKCKKRPALPEKAEELIKELKEKYIGSLSELEKIKLSFASALTGEPSLILFRAPAKNAEPSEIKKLGSLIDELREYTNIIYSCNIPSLFGEHSDKLLVISEGKTVGFSDTEEMFALSKKDGGLLAKIKGDLDAASGFLSSEDYTLEPSEKSGIFTVRCTDSEQTRKEIRAVVRKLGMALLSMKADNDVLKDMFSSLSQREEELAISEELDEVNSEEAVEENNVLPEKASNESQAPDKNGSQESPTPVRKPKISISFAHSDEEDDE